MMDEKWINISELKKITKIPSATVERYLNRFAHLLRCEERGRGKFYPPETAAILLRIYQLSNDERRDMDEIEQIIKSEFNLSITIDVESEQSLTASSHHSSLITRDDLLILMEMMKRELDDVREENRRLREQIEKQLEEQEQRMIAEIAAAREQTYAEINRQLTPLYDNATKNNTEINELMSAIKKRDEILLETLREIRDSKKSFWRRLLGR
jgi:hypothetical protein